MYIYTKRVTRRTFLGATAILLLSLPVGPLAMHPNLHAAQPIATDGYGLGTYNQGHYPAQQQNIYLPLITKGA